jgi:hypothetical protein
VEGLRKSNPRRRTRRAARVRRVHSMHDDVRFITEAHTESEAIHQLSQSCTETGNGLKHDAWNASRTYCNAIILLAVYRISSTCWRKVRNAPKNNDTSKTTMVILISGYQSSLWRRHLRPRHLRP